MNLMQVNGSSNVAAIGYDPDTETLAIQFHSGVAKGVAYEYSPVPAAVWVAFQESSSKGSFFASRIKTRWAGRKVTL